MAVMIRSFALGKRVRRKAYGAVVDASGADFYNTPFSSLNKAREISPRAAHSVGRIERRDIWRFLHT
jgi:hypothetical protein